MNDAMEAVITFSFTVSPKLCISTATQIFRISHIKHVLLKAGNSRLLPAGSYTRNNLRITCSLLLIFLHNISSWHYRDEAYTLMPHKFSAKTRSILLELGKKKNELLLAAGHY